MAKNTTNTVTIASQTLSVVEYQGQRVVTLAMIDKVHERSEGTARKRFNDNKSRFIEGDDYFVRNSDEAREMGFTAPNGLTLITESGYLMLVKSFTDDLAWLVQRDLVRNYFRPRGEAAPRSKTPVKFDRVTFIRKAVALHGSILVYNKRQGMDLTQARIKAVASVKEQMGIDLSAELGWQPQPLEVQERTMTATQIGVVLGMSNRDVNQLLKDQGFHADGRDSKNRIIWSPTDKGRPFGRYEDKTKVHASGTVQPWGWFPSIVDALRPFARRRATAA